MIKVIWLIKRKAGMTKEAFRHHYETSHVKLAEQYVGHLLLTYNRNYPTEGKMNQSEGMDPPVLAPFEFDWDAITEMRVADQAASDEMFGIFENGESGKVFMEDENRFLDRKRVVMLQCHEEISKDGIRGGAENY